MTRAAVSFTAAGIRRGFFTAQVMAPGITLYAMVFGVLASERGMSWLQAMLMSAAVYSGSAQLAALQGWTATAAVTPVIVTILVMNARYVLYGAALQPWLAGLPRHQSWGSLFFLGDGNWAMAMREYEAGYRDAGYVLGSGVAMFVPWLGGTLAGHLLAGSVPNPAAFGLDFMLVAFAAAIGMVLWRGKSDLWPAVAAGLAGWLVYRLVPGAWYIVAAGIAGGLMGAWRHGR
ncbi:MAG: AzlC family ABC transporter permease [Polaromonas sp.]